MSGALYVYAVTAASDAEAMPVATVREGDLAALVADASSGSAKASRAVREHWRVLEQAIDVGTVVPLRFGTVMAGEEAVRSELLAAHADRLAALLDELRGRVQISVKGRYAEEGLLRGVVEGSSAIASLRERLRRLPPDAGYYERIRLGELVATEVDRRREADTAHALRILEPLAALAHAEPVTAPDVAFNLAFLVERGGVERFVEAANGLAADFGGRVDVRTVGPLAPYSFADLELSQEAA